MRISRKDAERLLRGWIRTQHLICYERDFIFETVDQTHLDRFEQCMLSIGSDIRKIEAVGNWPMGNRRAFKILRAKANVPRPGGEKFIEYWAKNGKNATRYSEIDN